MEQSASTHETRPLEWNGDAYHRLSDMQFDVAMQFLATLPLQPDETILDAGCGSGRITRELLARLPHGGVIGVDLSGSMLETARKVVIPTADQSAKFEQADLQTYCAPGSVDGVFSSMALHFVHDHAALFANLAKTLRPGGWLALQFGSDSMLQANMMQQMRHAFDSAEYGPYLQGGAFDFRGSTVADTRKDLQGAGFEDISITEEPIEFSGAYRDKMVEYFRITMEKDWAERLPAALRPRFLQEMQDMLEHSFGQKIEYLRVRAHLPQAH